MLKLSDSFSMKDSVSYSNNPVAAAKNLHSPTLWVRTRVIGGHGLHTNSKGVSEFDEVVFDTENMVPIGGVQYAMEMIFGVTGPLNIPTLNESMGIGAATSDVSASGGMPYPYGQKVCLFGVGTGGAASNNLSVLDEKYYETNIADMIPIRYTNELLSTVDATKYYGKKTIDDIMAYYLKRFDADPVIRHLYKNGEEGEDGSEVEAGYINIGSDTGVQSFTEMSLTITKKDVREWFAHNGKIEEARINTIGLYTAVYDNVAKDYHNIKLFSKLNIPTEPLALSKDMNILYRVYGA